MYGRFSGMLSLVGTLAGVVACALGFLVFVTIWNSCGEGFSTVLLMVLAMPLPVIEASAHSWQWRGPALVTGFLSTLCTEGLPYMVYNLDGQPYRFPRTLKPGSELDLLTTPEQFISLQWKALRYFTRDGMAVKGVNTKDDTKDGHWQLSFLSNGTLLFMLDIANAKTASLQSMLQRRQLRNLSAAGSSQHLTSGPPLDAGTSLCLWAAAWEDNRELGKLACAKSRQEPPDTPKGALCRRLHTAIVREYLEAAMADD